MADPVPGSPTNVPGMVNPISPTTLARARNSQQSIDDFLRRISMAMGTDRERCIHFDEEYYSDLV